MPTVPQYNRQVAPVNTPTPYKDLQLNQDMFGGNVYKAQENLGNAMSGMITMLSDIKERVDNTKIVELANRSSEWEQTNLYDKENGYYYKTGKDAYGKSKDIMDDYDKYMNKFIEEARFSPSASRRAKETVIGLRGRINQSVTAHDFKQGITWSNSEAETGKMNYINNAVNMRNNPNEISKSLISGYQIIEWQGEIQHKDEATIRQEKMQYRSTLHEAVLSSLLAEGSLKAGSYLEEHKQEIQADKLPNYVSAVKSNQLSYTARSTAMGMLDMSVEDAYKKINSISDPQTRNATMQEYNNLMAQKNTIQTAKNNQFMSDLSNQLADALANGGDANMLKQDILKSDLPFDVKQKQISFINDCLELNQEVHLWNETEYLENLMHTDNEAFKKIDLSKFALSKAEREKYLKAQQNVVDYSSEAQLREMVKEFDTFFWAGKNGLDGNVYKDELIGLLARIEKLQGEAFDIKNIDKGDLKTLIEGFGYKSDIVANKNIDETKELYMRAKAVAEVQERVARAYVQFKSQNKRNPEPSEMFTMVQKIYNDVGRENKNRTKAIVDKKLDYAKAINQTQIKKVGYTKVLTNFEEKTIPNLERDTGVKMVITSTYRASGKYGHEKGLKADVFPQNPTKENILKAAAYLIASPDVEVIFTSNPYVLARYGTNKKVHDARKYDNSSEAKKAGIEHVTHFDITLTKQFGGTEQIKPAVIKSSNPVIQKKR